MNQKKKNRNQIMEKIIKLSNGQEMMKNSLKYIEQNVLQNDKNIRESNSIFMQNQENFLNNLPDINKKEAKYNNKLISSFGGDMDPEDDFKNNYNE